MREEKASQAGSHSLTLESRARAQVTGVVDVEMFNEQLVALSTASGTLTIMGAELTISQLSLENGQLLVQGRIDALEYDDRQKRRGLAKLFK